MKVLSAFVAILAVAAARVAVSPNVWTIQELEAALYDPSTPADLKPYLTEAFDNLMQQIFEGGVQTSAPVITPYGVLPAPSAVAVVHRPIPSETVAPVAPAEVMDHVIPAAESASPLIQIIVNINAEQLQAMSPIPVVVSPVPEAVIPTPVAVVEQPAEIEAPTPIEVIDVPTPINPIDVIAITPPEVNPIDVIDVPTPINPIDVIAINPPEMLNPVDVIAIAAPDVNPIDILAPLPAVAGGNVGIIV